VQRRSHAEERAAAGILENARAVQADDVRRAAAGILENARAFKLPMCGTYAYPVRAGLVIEALSARGLSTRSVG
jgi:hypothetical protein